MGMGNAPSLDDLVPVAVIVGILITTFGWDSGGRKGARAPVVYADCLFPHLLLTGTYLGTYLDRYLSTW